MKRSYDPKSLGAAFGAGLLATVAMLPQAKGELVFENDVKSMQVPAAAAPVAPRTEERESLRQVLSVSEKAPQPAAVSNSAAPVTEVQNFSKTELMRRERVREEVKNEDVLQERLEELRLRDEQRRTEQLLGVASAHSVTASAAPLPVKEERISAPVTEVPATRAVAAGETIAVAGPVDAVEKPEKLIVSISPRAGISSMMGNSGFDIRPNYAAGVAVGLGVSDNLTFEAGYTYGEYGVAVNSTNPTVQYLQNYFNAQGGYLRNFETQTMRQNIVDAGLKVHFLGPEARLRPFFGAGAAYSKSYLNYAQSYLTMLNQMGMGQLSRDYEVDSYQGYLSTGLDVRVSKNISIGATFKYHTVLSARENQPLYYSGFSGSSVSAPYYGSPYGAYNAGYNGTLDYDKMAVGGSLARTSFYTVLAGVTFTF